MFIPAKRVSSPLKVQLCRSDMLTDSGSEHDADPLFSGPIHAFFVDQSSNITAANCNDINNDHIDDKEEDNIVIDSDNSNQTDDADTLRDLLDVSRKSDPFLLRLHADVMMTATETSSTTREVMTWLRERGYNAGLCKVKWESNGSSLTAGSYEYVDVVVPNESTRYIVDLGFGAEFEVARATEEYKEVVGSVPRVMVGRTEDVKMAVRILAEAAGRSMKRTGLHLPPWRKRRYIMAKWFGPYKRTTSAAVPVRNANVFTARKELIKCRAVGFGVAMTAPVMRTR